MTVEHDLAPIAHTALVTGTEPCCDVQASHELGSSFDVQDPQLCVVGLEVVFDLAGSQTLQLEGSEVTDLLEVHVCQVAMSLPDCVVVDVVQVSVRYCELVSVVTVETDEVPYMDVVI